MNSKTLIKLVAALIVLGGIAYFMNKEPAQDDSGSAGTVRTGDEVLKDLDVNAVATIKVTAPDKNSTVTRKNEKWVVDSLYDYEADFDKIVSNLTDWQKIKAADLPRGGDDAEYGLDTNATVVTLLDASGADLAVLKLGENRQSKSGGGQFGGGMPDGRYIRVGDGPVLLISDNMTSLPSASEDWVKTDFLSVNSSEITEVAITVSNVTKTIDTSDTANYQVSGVSTNEEANTANCGRAHRAIQSLRFDSVADPAKDDAALGLDQPITYVAKTKEGIAYTLHLGNELDGGNRYARLATAYTAAAAPTQADAEAAVPPDAPKPEPTEGEAAKPEEKTREQKVADKLQELIAAHEAKVTAAQLKLADLEGHTQWVYVLGSLDVEPLLLTRKDLVSLKADDAEPPSVNPPSPGSFGAPQGFTPPQGLTPPPGLARPPAQPKVTPAPKPKPTPKPANTATKPKTVVTTPPIKVPPLPKADPLKPANDLINQTKDAVKNAGTPKLPGVGEPIEVPKLDLKPKGNAPKLTLPKVETPKVDLPKVDVPKVEIPKIEAPKVDVPKIKAPKVNVPKVDVPKAADAVDAAKDAAAKASDAAKKALEAPKPE